MQERHDINEKAQISTTRKIKEEIKEGQQRGLLR